MYDIAIIGGGPGGYVAAEKAGKKGLKTILFEKKDLGGVCLNEGCIPTKTLLYSAKLYDYARKSEKYGVRVEEATLDYKKMTDRKTKVMRKLVAGIGLRMKNAGVEVVKAEATISGRTDCALYASSPMVRPTRPRTYSSVQDQRHLFRPYPDLTWRQTRLSSPTVSCLP